MPLVAPGPGSANGDLVTALERAALDLVAERGPHGFSLNEASRRAGVSVAAPYKHFADREALLASLAAAGDAVLATVLPAARAVAADEQAAFDLLLRVAAAAHGLAVFLRQGLFGVSGDILDET